jgi:hypothetical protein
MAHHEAPRPPYDEPTPWWVVGAWASLGLVVLGGLAGAAGLG